MKILCRFKLINILLMYVAVISIEAFPQGHLEKEKPEIPVCLKSGCVHAASKVLMNINTSTNPCDDFYKFACGGFLQRTIIPADQSFISSYTLISDSVKEKLKLIIDRMPRANISKPFLQLRQLYRTCSNRSGGWPVTMGSNWNESDFSWQDSIYKLRKRGYGASYLLSVTIGINPKNSSQRIIILDQAGLGLNRKYLLKGLEEKVVKAYYEYMVNVSKIFGANETDALDELYESLEFETKLANISLDAEQRRNISGLYHPMTIKTLQEAYPSIPWSNYISSVLAVEITEDEPVVVRVPDYITNLEDLLEETSPRTLANYLIWRTVKDSVSYLSQALTEQKLKFDQIYKGITERRHRSRECVDVVAQKMELAIGALYARRFFSRDARKKVTEMMSDVQSEFINILEKIDWMDEVTRESAIEKAVAMTSSIAFTDELFANNKYLEEYYLKLQLNSDDYLLSSLNVSLFKRSKTIEKFRERVNKTDWTTRASPLVVNAFYDSYENSMQFPAGILQGAYFENDRPNYMNYGAIGNVIGHEITHGFDDKGRQFDKDGNLVDWWAEETRHKFTERAQCIIDQYSSHSVPEIKLKLNGVNTQGENIADNGGVKEAYLAYQTWVKRNGPEPQLPGLNYTPNQMFWISAANPYCSKATPEFLKLRVLTNPHSPEEYRVNVVFSNTEQFANDFNCPLGSNMNPEHKCKIW